MVSLLSCHATLHYVLRLTHCAQVMPVKKFAYQGVHEDDHDENIKS